MKKRYTTPCILSEEFSTNEYIAACWGVACDVNQAERLESKLHNGYAPHQQRYCGQSTHQYIKTDANNIAVSMQENESPYVQPLTCTIYTDDTYKTVRSINEVKPGNTIYWTTTGTNAFGTITYHHVGVVHQTYTDRPNHS